MPEQAGYSPHPIAVKATHAEADLPNAPPVGPNVALNNNGRKECIEEEAQYIPHAIPDPLQTMEEDLQQGVLRT